MLGNHIAIISEGRIRQVRTTQEVFNKPNSECVARFTMMRNILPGMLSTRKRKPQHFPYRTHETGCDNLERGSNSCLHKTDDITLSTALSFHVITDMPPEVCVLVTRRNFIEVGLIIGQKPDPDSPQTL